MNNLSNVFNPPNRITITEVIIKSLIERQKDNKFLNGSEIIGTAKTHDYFLKWLDSLRIENSRCDYYLEK